MIIINPEARNILKAIGYVTDDQTSLNLDIVLPDGNYVLPDTTEVPDYVNELKVNGLPYEVRELTQVEKDFINGSID